MNDLTITPYTLLNKAPARLEVIEARLVAALDKTMAEANLIKEVTAENAAEANRICAVLAVGKATVEEQRVAAKAPYLEMGRLIDGIAKKLSEPVDGWHKRMLALIAPYNAKVEAERKKLELEEAQKRAKAEAEAEAERKRLQKIEDDKHAAEVAAAQKLADEEEAEIAKIMGKAPAAAAPVEIAKPAPVVVKPAYVPSAIAHREVVKSAVTTRKEPKLIITDPRAVARTFEIGGIEIVEIKTGPLTTVLRNGGVCEGAHLEWVDKPVMAPGAK